MVHRPAESGLDTGEGTHAPDPVSAHAAEGIGAAWPAMPPRPVS